MTVFEWLALGYCLIVMVTLAICFHVRRRVKYLQAENRMLRAEYALLERIFKSVAMDWAELLHGREGNDADSSAEQG